MPIQWFYRSLYRGAEWEQIRKETLERAGYRCRDCGAFFGPLYAWKLHVSHDNHDPRDRRKRNLVARCAACHNKHDGPMKAATARRSLAARSGQAWIAELEFAHLPKWAERFLRKRRRQLALAARRARAANARTTAACDAAANSEGRAEGGAARAAADAPPAQERR